MVLGPTAHTGAIPGTFIVLCARMPPSSETLAGNVFHEKPVHGFPNISTEDTDTGFYELFEMTNTLFSHTPTPHIPDTVV